MLIRSITSFLLLIFMIVAIARSWIRMELALAICIGTYVVGLLVEKIVVAKNKKDFGKKRR